MRRYESTWKNISESSKPVRIICASSFAPRLIQALRKEKSRYNKVRERLDLPGYGIMDVDIKKLDIKRVEITFTLRFNGDML